MGSWHRLVARAAAALSSRGKRRQPPALKLRGEQRRAAEVLRRMRALQEAVLKSHRD
jgi:hypothetical protein